MRKSVCWISVVVLASFISIALNAQSNSSAPARSKANKAASAAATSVLRRSSVKLLPWSQQIAIRESWLPQRYEMLLDMMRKRGLGMFIIVNEEFHNDPMTEFIAPPRVYTGNRDIFVFVDAGQEGLKKFAITGYAEENLKRFFETWDEPRPAEKVLPELYEKYQPQKIALSMEGKRGVTRSLTHDSYLFLSKAMGPEATSRFVSDADLLEEYLDTRIPEETEVYLPLVRLTEDLARRALSNEVITPGKTTLGDIRRWLYDQLWANSVTTWFQPDLRLQRKGMKNETSRGFLAVAPEEWVVQRGDLVHLDFGITYMGLNTDWQKEAYVLRPGETDAPAGLKHALANTNALQDALMLRASRPGRPAGEVYHAAIAEMEQKGIEAKIYSHPVGNQGHGLGPSIDYRGEKKEEDPEKQEEARKAAAKPLRKGSWIAIELNTQTPVPEWDNQKVYMMEEDPAYLTDEGWKFFVPRQEKLYLVK